MVENETAPALKELWASEGDTWKQGEEYGESMYSTNTEGGGPLPLTENLAGADLPGSASQRRPRAAPCSVPKRAKR